MNPNTKCCWYILYYKVYSFNCSKCTACLTSLSLNITIIFLWWSGVEIIVTTRHLNWSTTIMCASCWCSCSVCSNGMCVNMAYTVYHIPNNEQHSSSICTFWICFVSLGWLQLLMKWITREIIPSSTGCLPCILSKIDMQLDFLCDWFILKCDLFYMIAFYCTMYLL